MKWSFASLGIIIIGLSGILIIVLFNEITVSNEQDYFTLKEATEASMIEAIDTTYYRLTGKIKISQEKFVENFTQRFAQSATFGQGNYYVDFYQISEYPPKVSLRIIDNTNSYNIYTTLGSSNGPTQAKIVNELSAILDGHESLNTVSNGIYPISYWDVVPSGAKKPTLSCPNYEAEDKSKVKDLKYDLSNPNNYLCIYYKKIPEGTISSGEYELQIAPAKVKCNGLVLVKGWCVKG